MILRFLSRILILLIIMGAPLFSQALESPEAVFDFKMGEDRKLVNWEQITSYLQSLDAASDRIKVVELGQTTLERPLLMAIISSAETIADLDKYRRIQAQLARPYELSEAAAAALIDEGKTVCLITMNIHSNEIAASQESLELAHQLVTADDAETRHILDNVILLMVPSLNPDGQDMITKWYQSTVGSAYEGSRMPYKYHYYADHDNNRDWFFFSLQESRLVANVLYKEWFPEIVMDQHQMGSTRARFFLPPYSDPVNPNVPPSLMANLNMAGKHMLAEMHDQGFKGLVSGTIFNAYFEGTMSKTPLWHNRIGILTEAASVRYASPMYFPRTSLGGMGIDLPEYKQQTNFLDPWPGGWWRLRDIVEYQKAAALSLLKLSATFREKFKTNFYQLNKRAIEVKPEDHPLFYLMPQDQHDPGNMLEMLKRLRFANVEVYQAEKDFQMDGRDYRKGDFIIPLAQPTRAYIKDLMEVQRYPNLREYPGGPPRQPYDVTGWTLPMQMGITALPGEKPLTTSYQKVDTLRLDINTSLVQAGWMAIERRNTNSYRLVNNLQRNNLDILALNEELQGYDPGTFMVWCDEKNRELLQQKSQKYNVQLSPLLPDEGMLKIPASKIRPARIGVYQPWISWAYDEGWLRWVLDEFDYEYETLHNDQMRGKYNLNKNLDVIIFGSQRANSIVNGRNIDQRPGEPAVRENYTGGISASGVQRLKNFIEQGGTALFFGDACNLAIDKLKLPVTNALRNYKRDDYFIPGSILEMSLDTGVPLTYGMEKKAHVYINNQIALKLRPYPREIREIGFYNSHHLLKSGWAVGVDKLDGLVGLAEIPLGKGKVILYAFRPQHRSQTYGTFKLIFNALYQ